MYLTWDKRREGELSTAGDGCGDGPGVCPQRGREGSFVDGVDDCFYGLACLFVCLFVCFWLVLVCVVGSGGEWAWERGVRGRGERERERGESRGEDEGEGVR